MTARRFFGSTVKIKGGLSYTPPLDIFNNCLAAFSVRLLRTGYTGPCIRIADSSNVETDIGFDSAGLIDTAQVVAHVGVNNAAFIVKAYDQSGNGNDFTGGATNGVRKQISFSTTGIYYLNGIPAFYGNSADAGPGSKSFLMNTRVQIGSLIAVGQIVANGNTNYIGWDSTTQDGVFTGGNNVNATGFGIVKSNAFSALVNTAENTNQRLWEYFGGATDYVYTDGANVDSATIVNPWIREIGRTIANSGGANFTMNGPLQELMIFSDDKLSDRSSIESNVNDYYSIY